MPREQPNGFAALVVAFVEALLVALVASGFLHLSDTQTQLWVNLAAATVAIATPMVGFYWTKINTTPLSSPKDIDGAPLVRSDGSMPKAQAKRNA